jgi:formate-dependent nitrite reductase membrane component NrfD
MQDPSGPGGRHGAAFGGPAQYSPDAVAASLSRGDGGFGREQSTYYEFPALRKAHWRWEISTYFFVGGLMNGSAAMAGIADIVAPDAYPELVRYGRWVALLGALGSGALLIKDLGRPERFLNMLRILKLKSPMSVGVWAVMAMSVSAGINAMDQLDRDEWLPAPLHGVVRLIRAVVPRPLRGAMLGLSSSFTATYVGVLLSATAIPVWYRGRWFIPPLFVLSGATTSCALHAALLALRGDCEKTVAKLEKIEALASLAELGFLLAYERSAGDVGKTLFAGETGRRLKQMTMIGGLIVPLALQLPGLLRRGVHKPNPVRALAGAALTLTGGWVLRDSMLRAGRASADDPRPVLRKAG